MKFTIVCRKCSVNDNFRERAEKKLKKIERFFGDSAEAKITVSAEKNKHIVEVTVNRDGMVFRSEERADDVITALDLCIDSLIRQIRRNKTKLEKRLRSGAFDEMVDAAADEVVPEEEDFDLVRTKVVELRPESVDEAILKMNMIGHKFYVFCNGENGKVCVVYARNGGGYGLIEPEVV